MSAQNEEIAVLRLRRPEFSCDLSVSAVHYTFSREAIEVGLSWAQDQATLTTRI